MQAPAIMNLVSASRLQLDQGSVAVYCPDGSQGFVVATPGATITDLGTAFGVRVDETGATEVLVAHGKVRLRSVGGSGSARSRQLGADECAAVGRDGRQVTIGDRPALVNEFARTWPARSLLNRNLIVNGDFEADAVNEWRVRPGTWLIEAGEYKFETADPEKPSGDREISIIPTDKPWPASLLFETNLRISGDAVRYAHVVFDFHDLDNYKFVEFVFNDAWVDHFGQVELCSFHRVSSSDYTSTQHRIVKAPQLVADKDHHVSLQLNGKTAIVKVNGKELTRYTYSDELNDGRLGVGSTVSNTYFDNIRVSSDDSVLFWEDFEDFQADKPGALRQLHPMTMRNIEITGWDDPTRATAIMYASDVWQQSQGRSQPLGAGRCFFTTTEEGTTRQQIDVTGLAREIDAGETRFKLSGMLGSSKDEGVNLRLTMTALDEQGQALDVVELEPVRGKDGLLQFAPRSVSSRVPVGTRSMRIELVARGAVDSNDDKERIAAYADNLSLILSVARSVQKVVPPEK